jgi:hypothetical protein
VRFPFVQLEFTHPLGPPVGRYVVRGVNGSVPTAAAGGLHALLGPDPALMATADVLVIDGESRAPRRRRVRQPRAAVALAGKQPTEVQLFVYTVVKGTRALDDLAEAEAFFATLRDSLEQAEEWVADALEIVNRAIAAHRACAADPHAIEVSRMHPRSVRVGYGTGEKVFHGTWEQAVELPAPAGPRIRRELRLMPQHGMADVLAAGAPVLEGEELVLRTGVDLEHGRSRAAAVGLRGGVQLLLGELMGGATDSRTADRLDELRERSGELDDLAGRALEGPLGDDDTASLLALAELAGSVVDAWRYQPSPADSGSSGSGGL